MLINSRNCWACYCGLSCARFDLLRTTYLGPSRSGAFYGFTMFFFFFFFFSFSFSPRKVSTWLVTLSAAMGQTFDLHINLWPRPLTLTSNPTFDLDLWPLHWPLRCNQGKKADMCQTLTFDLDLWPQPLTPTFDLNLYPFTQRGAVHFCVQKFLSGLAGLVYFIVQIVIIQYFQCSWLLWQFIHKRFPCSPAIWWDGDLGVWGKFCHNLYPWLDIFPIWQAAVYPDHRELGIPKWPGEYPDHRELSIRHFQAVNGVLLFLLFPTFESFFLLFGKCPTFNQKFPLFPTFKIFFLLFLKCSLKLYKNITQSLR